MKKFILIHTWKYGQEGYLIESNSTEEGILENVHSVCEMVGIDFEENGEFITVQEVKEPIKSIIL